MDDATERWLPVPGHEGLYEVSDFGRVRSLDRMTRTKSGSVTRRHRGRILHPVVIGNTAYLRVTLYRDGPEPVRKRQTVREVHVLVLEAFRGLRPEPGYEARHLDGNAHNNVLTNLVWGTRKENQQDVLRHGRNYHASKTHCKHGHPFDEANTRIRLWPNGTLRERKCKACNGRGPYRKIA